MTEIDITTDNTQFQIFNDVMSAACIHGWIGHCSAAILFLWLGVIEMFLFNIFVSVPVFTLAFLLNRQGKAGRAFSIIYIEIIAHQTVGIYLLGWDIGLQHLLLCLSIISFFNVHYNYWQKYGAFTVALLIYFALFLFCQTPVIELEASWMYTFAYLVTSLVSVILLAMLVTYFVNSAYHAERQLIRNQDHLSLLALTDPLTSLFNRRAFIENCQKTLDEAQTDSSPTSLMMIDVDNFKTINDTYGHDAGDRVLINIAQQLKKLSGKSNMIARFGGEEFIVMLPDTTIDLAKTTAEQIRKSISSLTTISDAGTPIITTVSIGAYQPEKNDEPLRDIIRQCDKNLYIAKNTGKNRVCAS